MNALGRGIRYRLQGHVPSLGPVAANAFDLLAWRETTTLKSFGVELFVEAGTVTVSLEHIAPDGTRSEFARLQAAATGSAYSPPIFIDQTEGALLPRIIDASDDARFDICFGTNEMPSSPFSRTAFIVEGKPEQLSSAADAYQRHVQEQEVLGARQRTRLVIVDDSGGANPCPDPNITWLANDRTGGATAIGQGLYAVAYGALARQGFTHACLLRAGAATEPEMFARCEAFTRYLRDGHHLAATCSDVGDASDIAACLRTDRRAGRAGWQWCCLDLCDVHRNGLPCPFPSPVAEAEFGSRLQDGGSRLFVPLSLWMEQPDSPVIARRYRWAMAAMQGSPISALADAYAREQDASIAQGAFSDACALSDEMEAFLAGPDRLNSGTGHPTGTDGPLKVWRLKRRLRRQLSQLDDHAGPANAYRTAPERLGSIPCWARLEGNTPPAPGAASGAGAAELAALQRAISTAYLKSELLQRRQQDLWGQRFRDLEGHLRHNRLLDSARVHADQDRPNQIVLSLLRNRHAGRRAFVIGNGPSLRIADLDRLKDEVTFASNKIYLAYDQTDWRPTYYSVEDHLVIKNNWDRIAGLQGSLKIFPGNVRDFGYHAADTIFVPFHPPKSFADPLSDPAFPDFSDDLSHGICWGSTIVYSQIQMAAFMGCAEICLIGLDHFFHLPSQKIGNVYLHEGEQNHFHPDYRAPGERWHQPNLDVLEVSYARARAHCEARGIRILNASRQTRLDVFERAGFDDLLAERAP